MLVQMLKCFANFAVTQTTHMSTLLSNWIKHYHSTQSNMIMNAINVQNISLYTC